MDEKYLRRAFRSQVKDELLDLLPPALKRAWIDKMNMRYVSEYVVDEQYWPPLLYSAVAWYSVGDTLLTA